MGNPYPKAEVLLLDPSLAGLTSQCLPSDKVVFIVLPTVTLKPGQRCSWAAQGERTSA